MKADLRECLARHAKLAFRRVQPGAELIKKYYALPVRVRRDPYLQRVKDWLMVPFSLWPVDLIGIASHLISLAELDKHQNSDIQKLIELLGDAPKIKTCDAIGAHEHHVKREITNLSSRPSTNLIRRRNCSLKIKNSSPIGHGLRRTLI